MKLKFITNACQAIEQNGYKLLCDPWLHPTAFYGSWEHDPPVTTKAKDVLDVDSLYISHIHEDHLCPHTMKHFRKDIPIFTLQDRLSLCAKHLEKLGFVNVVTLEDKESVKAGPFELTMFAPFVKHPYHDSDIGNVVDSALLIEHGGKSILNTNDNMPTVEAAEWLREEYGPFTIAQVNFGNAGPFPSCFRNLSKEQKIDEHNKAVARNLANLVAVGRALGAKYTMPFAGAYKIAAPRAHLNEYLGTVPYRKACDYLAKHDLQAIYLEENDEFNVE